MQTALMTADAAAARQQQQRRGGGSSSSSSSQSAAAAAPDSPTEVAWPWPHQPTAVDVRPQVRTQPRAMLLMADVGGEALLAYMEPCIAQSALPRPAALAAAESADSRRASGLTMVRVRSALRATLAVATELMRLHGRGIVHRALSPSSILLEPVSGRVQFLDLSAASPLLKERVESDLNLSLHSTSSWLFASPEQSGKANRAVDCRSDLYSLGAIMMVLLTGQPPFAADDPLALIHMHLAKAPPRILPRHFTPFTQPLMHPLLKATQSIVHRLLQKQAEDRYQSCQGLIHDLRAVLQALALHESSLAGAVADASTLPSTPVTRSRHPPTDQLISLCTLAARGNLDGVKAALDADPDLLNCGDYDWRTPLHHAVSESQIDVVRFLLSLPSLRINRVDRWGGTPYTDAVRGGHYLVAELLRAALESQAASPAAPSAPFTHSSHLLSSAGIIALTKFEAGKLDQVSTFCLSQKLYGREREVELLRQAYARVAQPAAVSAPVAPQLVLISGYSGVVSETNAKSATSTEADWRK